jgi:hypothetical protein
MSQLPELSVEEPDILENEDYLKLLKETFDEDLDPMKTKISTSNSEIKVA